MTIYDNSFLGNSWTEVSFEAEHAKMLELVSQLKPGKLYEVGATMSLNGYKFDKLWFLYANNENSMVWTSEHFVIDLKDSIEKHFVMYLGTESDNINFSKVLYKGMVLWTHTDSIVLP